MSVSELFLLVASSTCAFWLDLCLFFMQKQNVECIKCGSVVGRADEQIMRTSQISSVRRFLNDYLDKWLLECKASSWRSTRERKGRRAEGGSRPHFAASFVCFEKIIIVMECLQVILEIAGERVSELSGLERKVSCDFTAAALHVLTSLLSSEGS